MSTFDVRIGINPLSWMNDDLPSLGGETPLSVALTEGRKIGYEGFELVDAMLPPRFTEVINRNHRVQQPNVHVQPTAIQLMSIQKRY